MSEVISAHEAIARAKPFIDANPHRQPEKWAPSELLVIGWSMIASGAARDAMDAADAYVRDLIAEARNRWAAGFYADPFAEPAQPRIAAALRAHATIREADKEGR